MAQTYEDKPTLAAWNAMAASGGNCKIVTGSYMGQGLYAPPGVTLTFDGKPQLVIVRRADSRNKTTDYTLIAFRGPEWVMTNLSDGNSSVLLTWTDSSLNWYGLHNPEAMLNYYGVYYHYLAVIETNS